MATATKICKVCGKEYPYCKTERKVAGVFRWQDVACSVEHGSIYLERVLASRKKSDLATDTPAKEVAPVEEERAEAKVATNRKPRKTSAKNAK